MPPLRPSSILLRAHRASQVSSLPTGSLTRVQIGAPGFTHPAGARTLTARAARAAAAQPLRALSSLLAPAHQPVTPQELRPIGRHLPPRLTPSSIGQLPARGGADTAGTQNRGPQPGGREGRWGHVDWWYGGGARGGPKRPFWGRRGFADPGSLAPEHPLGSVGSALRVLFSKQISVHSPFCPSSASADAEYSSVAFRRKFLRSLPTSARPASLLACLISNRNQNPSRGFSSSGPWPP